MGKCLSKQQGRDEYQEETQEVLLEIDPGGGPPKMTGGTLLAGTPGRWGVPPGGHTTRKAAFIATPGICGNRKPIITSNLGARQGAAGGMVTKTYQFKGTDGTGAEVRGVKSGRYITTCQAFVSGTTQPANNLNYESNRRSSFSVTSTQKGKRMAKTKTETTVRTYTKDGKRYEETTVVETKEEDDGTITTTTRTTTKTLGSHTTTRTVTEGVEGLKLSHGGRKSRVSSTSSNDSSPTRVKSQQKNRDTAESKTKKGGFLNKFKGGDKSSDSSDDEEDFAKSVLNSVNDYRAKHGVAKLKLSKELNKYAKIWAKKLATEEKMSHNPDGKYGENVFCLSSNSTNFDAKPKEVVDHWYSEIKDHKFGEEPKGTALKSGHFSQLVWKDTKHMGVGKARSAAGTKVFVVANFDPQGNWMGQFADQVPPVGGFTKSAASAKPSKVIKTRKSSSSSESSSDEEDFAEDCLKAHNDYRKKHGAQPLKLSKKLSKVAKEWCETIAKKDVLQHRPNNQYGENLYCYYSPDPKFSIKGDEAVKSWYSEIKDFRFGAEPRDLRAGHFTQVVWADSKELGVARVKSRSGKTYVVANYNPPGNFVGSFASQVPRPK